MLERLKKAIRLRYVSKLTLTRAAIAEPNRKPVRLTVQDVQRLASRLPDRRAPQLEKRLLAGDRCYAVLNGAGGVDSFVWVASGRTFYVDDLEDSIQVPSGVAYLYDAVTFPEARDQGLIAEIIKGILTDDPAFERCEAWIRRDNRASIRALVEAGFEVYGWWRMFGLGPARVRLGEPWIGERPQTAARWPPVLMYHAVSRLPYDPNNICVSPEKFEAQMRYLKRRGLRGVSVNELKRAVEDGNAAGLVGLTFDDGYETFLSNALPILERLGFTATVFVVGGMLGGENSWDKEPRMRLLDADEIREVSQRGMEIGSHGMSHARLPEMDTNLLEREVVGGRGVLQEITGREVEGFCYPYGDLDWSTVQAVRQAGHGYACAYKKRIERSSYDIPRVYVGEKDGAFRLAFKLRWYSRLSQALR